MRSKQIKQIKKEGWEKWHEHHEWKHSNLFFALIVLAVGIVWYLRSIEVIKSNVIWPVIIIVIGVILFIKALIGKNYYK